MLSDDGMVAKCSKCSALLKVSVCGEAKSAKFVVLDESSRREVTLSAFERVLSRIVDGVSGVRLLAAPIPLREECSLREKCCLKLTELNCKTVTSIVFCPKSCFHP